MHESGIKLIMADVDGTLVTPEKDLTERSRQVVLQLRRAGFRFTVISSRPPYGLQSLAEAMQLEEPMVAFNGGMIATPEGKPLKQHSLSSELVDSVLECFDQFGVSPRLYTPDCWFIRVSKQPQPYLEHETCTIERKPIIVPDFSPYMKNVLKLTGVSNDSAVLSACRDRLNEILKDHVSALCSQPYYLDVTHPLANKGQAVKTMAALLHIPEKQIAVIGDMPSDVPMFREAGFSIAMGNADAVVKAQADRVTESNQNDGFAQAMEQEILNRAPQWVKA